MMELNAIKLEIATMTIQQALKNGRSRMPNDGKSQSTGKQTEGADEYETVLKQLSTNLQMPDGFVAGLASQIFDFCSDGEQVNRADLRFIMVHLLTSKPRDQTEAMLRVQNAGLHVMTMKYGKRLRFAQGPAEADSVERIYTRLARTFVAQCEALNHSGSARKGTVVKVSHGSQAIVGDVTRGTRDPELDETRLSTAPVDQTSKPVAPAVRDGSGRTRERVHRH
jgi:hypothetical protein